MPVNEIAIYDADRNELAVWLDDDLRLRLAAGDLLESLSDLVTQIQELRGESSCIDEDTGQQFQCTALLGIECREMHQSGEALTADVLMVAAMASLRS
jgi:hypothetical protein